MKCIVDDDVVLSQPLEGPLSEHVAAFATWAREQGYACASRYPQVLLAACFCRWLGQRAVSGRRVSAKHQARYLRFRARHVQVRREDATALGQFLEFLRHEGVIPAVEKAPRRLTPVERETQTFEAYLRNDRVLGEPTIAYYVPFVRRFLMDRFGTSRVTLSRLGAGDVVRFVQRQAARLHVKRAKQLTTALRSFLRYARYRGDIALDLTAAVPPVANWSMTSIPRAISADAVRELLASVSRRTAVGRRDYAILLLLARLGLRASEIVCLGLDDVDWKVGEVSVRGKGGHRTALPLPADAIPSRWRVAVSQGRETRAQPLRPVRAGDVPQRPSTEHPDFEQGSRGHPEASARGGTADQTLIASLLHKYASGRLREG